MDDNLIKDTIEDELDSSSMTIFEHLDELRTRIIYSICSVIVCFIACFFFAGKFLSFLLNSVAKTQFIQISVGEVFIVELKMALYLAIYFASPIIFYQIIQFISPGLKKSEKKYIIPVIIVAFSLFTTGAAFGYFVVLPFGANFLLGYGTEIAVNTISVAKYFSFASCLIIIMGAVFQIPLFLTFLSLINVVSSKKLLDIWQYVIVASFVLGAILTPSIDPFSQIIVALAILALYFTSIAFIKVLKK